MSEEAWSATTKLRHKDGLDRDREVEKLVDNRFALLYGPALPVRLAAARREEEATARCAVRAGWSRTEPRLVGASLIDCIKAAHA